MTDFPLELIDDNVKVEWDDIGEGFSGDYDPNDPDDVELLRFTVLYLSGSNKDDDSWPAYRPEDEVWEQVDDASYCTLVPRDTDEKILLLMLKNLMMYVKDKVEARESIKKECEWFSWIGPKDIEQLEKVS